MQKTALRLNGSTLIEVLIALVLLLTIFALGMRIVSNLTLNDKSHTAQRTKLYLQQIKANYQEKLWENDQTLQHDHLVSRMETENIDGFADRRKVKIYAYDTRQNIILDSLIFIEPVDETDQM